MWVRAQSAAVTSVAVEVPRRESERMVTTGSVSVMVATPRAESAVLSVVAGSVSVAVLMRRAESMVMSGDLGCDGYCSGASGQSSVCVG